MVKQKEKEYIKNNYGIKTYKEMGKELNRAQSYVYNIAKKLNLIKKSKDLPGEIWKEANGFKNYLVSNKGRVKNKKRQRVISTRVHEGYYDCRIHNHLGDKKSPRIHRLVAETFIPKHESNEVLIVNHIDGDKLNNKVSNLEWVTYTENLHHALAKGYYENNKGAVISTEEEVHDICRLFEAGYSYSEIEKENPKYTRSRTEGIRRRINWKEISKNYNW